MGTEGVCADQGWEEGGVCISSATNILSPFPALIHHSRPIQIYPSYIAGAGMGRPNEMMGTYSQSKEQMLPPESESHLQDAAHTPMAWLHWY